MTHIKFYEQEVKLNEQETVLDGLLRHGLQIPNGCRAGACQACLLQAHSGTVPPKAQVGLKNTFKARDYFLSCQCVPTAPLEVTFANEAQTKISSTVLDVRKIAPQILRIRLAKKLDARAGQFLNLWHENNGKPLVRSYSIASVPDVEDFFELHVKIIPGGQFSSWGEEHLKSGDSLTIQGPLGECFYTVDDLQKPLLLAGTGTGLAPLYGIIRDALIQGHTGPVNLLIAARRADQFYLREELAELQQRYLQLHVRFLCQTAADDPDIRENCDIYQYVKEQFPSTKGFRVYLCGGDSFVRKMKKQLFLSGTAMADIHADAFLPCS